MTHTINDVYKKLTKIESILKKVELEEEKLETEEKRIEKKENLILTKEEWNIIKKLDKKTKKVYSNLMQWKIHIWDNCRNKKERSEKGRVDYNCKVTKKACRFTDCPLNIK